MNLLVFFYFSVVHESLMDRQVFNWTQTISKNATEVFKNRENLENVKNKEKYIKMAISQSYGLPKKI